MTDGLSHPVNLEAIGNAAESRLPVGQLFWAAADLSRAARMNQRRGIDYLGTRTFGRLGMLGAGWELLRLERSRSDSVARAFLVTQQATEREYANDRRIPLEGWRAVGTATIRPCPKNQTPESLRSTAEPSVRLDHWLAPEQHASVGVNRTVVRGLLEEMPAGQDGVVWSVCRVQDTGRFDALRQAGMYAVERPRRYPELEGGSEALLQLWTRDSVS